MKLKLLIRFLPVFLISFLLVGYSIQDNPNNDSTTPGGSTALGTTLVLLHDSTTDTPQRKADRDTMRSYLRTMVGNYTVKTTDSNTTLPDLATYIQFFFRRQALIQDS